MRNIKVSRISDASVLHTRMLSLIDAKEVFVSRSYTGGQKRFVGTAIVCGILTSDCRDTIAEILDVITDYFAIASDVPRYMEGFE